MRRGFSRISGPGDDLALGHSVYQVFNGFTAIGAL